MTAQMVVAMVMEGLSRRGCISSDRACGVELEPGHEGDQLSLNCNCKAIEAIELRGSFGMNTVSYKSRFANEMNTEWYFDNDRQMKDDSENRINIMKN
ncbi:hypothetical protein EVAR_101210_1 [Eumeta japonica]|uniref:Uncharacterized protein n=1 Tax=Eumeta variegata TaxID=151549 RepID=A0A4C2ABG8_EUMVA|nr:hypothetical protein EVAR_101210_1 [Eumeta japonica]